jgi:hypothetical protein
MASAPVSLYPGAASAVRAGGVPIVAIYGGVAGGFVTNPQRAVDQGLPVVEILFVDPVNPAALVETATTVALQPGQTYVVTAGQTTNVSVNAASSGHRFSAVVVQPKTQFPPTPTPGPFPPAGPTTIARTIPSYLYEQYADDDDLQAFVASYNAIAQQYLDWINQVGLPVYTGPQIAAALLDWVAQGLYGVRRPALSSGRNRYLGPLNTWQFDQIPLNAVRTIGPQNVAATSDDVYKRIITWAFFKGDGRVFNVRWLKRRIMRFALGASGAPINPDNSYLVSVTFGLGNQVNIRFLRGTRTITGGALYNRFFFNQKRYDEIDSFFASFTPIPNAAVLKAAIDSGAVETPFQFTYVVSL